MAKEKATSSLAKKLVGKGIPKADANKLKDKVLQMALLANAAKEKKNGKSPNQKKIEAFLKSEGKKSEKEVKKARAAQAIEDMERVKTMQKELDEAVLEEKKALKKKKEEKDKGGKGKGPKSEKEGRRKDHKSEEKEAKGKKDQEPKNEKDGKGKDRKSEEKKEAKGKNDKEGKDGKIKDRKGEEQLLKGKDGTGEAVEFKNARIKNKSVEEKKDPKEPDTGGQKKRGLDTAASNTPPEKRIRTKSPALSVATDAASEQYKMKRAKAEEAMQSELESAFVVAAAKAENDGTDIEQFLADLDVDVASIASDARKRVAAEIEREEGTEEEEEEEEEGDEQEEDQESSASSEEEGEEEGSAADEGESDSDEEMPALEAPNEEEEENEEAGSEEAEEDQEDEAEEEEQDEQEAAPAKEKEDALQKAVVGAVRNSKTHKREWDKFDREIKGKKMPDTMRPLLRRKKTEIFNLWLDHKQDWDKVEVQVTRLSSTQNLSRKQWQAVQVKTLEKEMGEERLKDLVRKRTEQGLTYPDEDYPEDEREKWIYMPAGRMMRTDDVTAEELKTTANKTGGRNLLDAMTGEDGPLAAGACPTVKGCSEAGQKLIWKALDEESKEVAKKAKPPKDKNINETVVPKTILELGPKFRAFFFLFFREDMVDGNGSKHRHNYSLYP